MRIFPQACAASMAFLLAGLSLSCGGHAGYTVPPDQAFAGTLSVISGDGQSATVGTIFAQPLKVQYINEYGAARGGVVIQFIGPTAGAQVTFDAPPLTTYETVTDNGGFAVSPAPMAAGQAGPVEVRVGIQNKPVKSLPTFHLTNQ